MSTIQLSRKFGYSSWPNLILLGLITSFFILDLSLPLGVAAGVPYLICILWASRLGTPHVWFAAITTSLLVIVGIFFSPVGGEPLKILLNRGLALLVIWVTATSSVRWIGAEAALRHLNKHLEQIVQERTQRLTLLSHVANVLRDSKTWKTALPKILQAICSEMKWQTGFYWQVDPVKNLATCQSTFDTKPEHHTAFLEITYQTHVTPKNELPGQAWANGTPYWISDIAQHMDNPRMVAAHASHLCSGLAIPIVVDQTPIGIMEFFTCDSITPEQDFQDALESISTHIGQFIKRELAEQQAQMSFEALRTSHAELILTRDEALASAKANFLATMSHEIRTPLNGVIGPTELLLAENLSPDHREWLETILTCSESLLYIINNILDFSKMDAGKLTLETMPFRPRTLVDEILDIMGHAAKEKQIQFSGFVHAAVPDTLIGDPGRLRQILINLVGNAIKFTPAGDVSLSLTITSIDSHNRMLCLSVQDTGIGMNTETLAKLFQSFHQADAGMSRKFGGTGLGLAISNQLAELMQGTIQVESTLGTGSCFTVSIPLQIQEAASGFLLPQSLQGCRVCVVDAQTSSCQVLTNYLEYWGLAWVSTSTGSEALEILQQANEEKRPWQLVILVEPLPDIEVEQLGKTIINHPQLSTTHVVNITNSEKSGVTDPDQDSNFSVSLTKPIRYHQLLKTLTMAMNQDGLPDTSKTPRSLDLPTPEIGNTESGQTQQRVC